MTSFLLRFPHLPPALGCQYSNPPPILPTGLAPSIPVTAQVRINGVRGTELGKGKTRGKSAFFVYLLLYVAIYSDGKRMRGVYTALVEGEIGKTPRSVDWVRGEILGKRDRDGVTLPLSFPTLPV